MALNDIFQDIYECKTCGLIDTLCCCSECARTCHAGHDCVLKKTSPTAYCDCSEKCPCRSQEEGDQEERRNVFEILQSVVELFLDDHSGWLLSNQPGGESVIGILQITRLQNAH